MSASNVSHSNSHLNNKQFKSNRLLFDFDSKAQIQKKKGRNENKQVLKKYNSIKSEKKSEMDATLQAVNPGGYPGIGDRGHDNIQKGQKVK